MPAAVDRRARRAGTTADRSSMDACGPSPHRRVLVPARGGPPPRLEPLSSAGVDHFWKAEVGHFSRALKRHPPMGPTPSPDGSHAIPRRRGRDPPMGRTPSPTERTRSIDGEDAIPRWVPRHPFAARQKWSTSARQKWSRRGSRSPRRILITKEGSADPEQGAPAGGIRLPVAHGVPWLPRAARARERRSHAQPRAGLASTASMARTRPCRARARRHAARCDGRNGEERRGRSVESAVGCGRPERQAGPPVSRWARAAKGRRS